MFKRYQTQPAVGQVFLFQLPAGRLPVRETKTRKGKVNKFIRLHLKFHLAQKRKLLYRLCRHLNFIKESNESINTETNLAPEVEDN